MVTAYQGSGGIYGRVYGTSTGTPGATALVRSFPFPNPELTWVVTHNLNTQNMNVTLFDSQNNVMFAKIKAVTPNQFIVYLTEPMVGTVNVTFIV
jgi:hypothetical protein